MTLQTDQVTNILCGTSSGVILSFKSIEVVNRLKKELAHDTIKNYTVTYDQTWIFSKIQYFLSDSVTRSISFVQVTLFNKFLLRSSATSMNLSENPYKKDAENGLLEYKVNSYPFSYCSQSH